MGNVKSLANAEAVEKIKELAEHKVCLFCTYKNDEIVSRPMSTAAVDEDGTMWFMSLKDSDKNHQLMKDDKVYLMYMETGKEHYLSLSGHVDISTDRKKIEELWNPMAKAWVEGGKEDPNLTLLKVTPTDGHYWDSKHGKLVSMLKIAAAVITGNTGDDGGIEGDLKL